MQDLENEATGSDAELDYGDWVVDVSGLVGAPFDVETNNGIGVDMMGTGVDTKIVKVVIKVVEGVIGVGTAAKLLGLGDPRVDEKRGDGDEGGDVGVEEGDVVEVVGVVGEFVIVDADCHRKSRRGFCFGDE